MRWISGFVISLLLLLAGGYNHTPAQATHSANTAIAFVVKHTAAKMQLQQKALSSDFRKRYVTRPKYKMTISPDDADDDDQVETKKWTQALSFYAPVFYTYFSVHDVHSKARARQSEQPGYYLATPIYLRYRSIRV